MANPATDDGSDSPDVLDGTYEPPAHVYEIREFGPGDQSELTESIGLSLAEATALVAAGKLVLVQIVHQLDLAPGTTLEEVVPT